MMSGDTRANDDLSVFMITHLRKIRSKVVKYLLPPFLPLSVGPLRFVGCDLGSGFVAPATRRQKYNRG